MMRCFQLVAMASCLVLSSVCFAEDEAGFKPIFNGKTLEGWRGEEGWWRVEDGVIVGESTEDKQLSHNTFLVWDHGTVDDFELRLQFRISGTDKANSGIQFRGTQREDGHVIGYQADIDRAGSWIGALYDEAQRGVLAKRGQKTVVTEASEKKPEDVADPSDLFKNINIDGWNDYSITARDNHITLKINGDVTAELIDNDPSGLDRTGLLALQLHSGPPMKIEFKNIRLKRFPLKEGWKKVVFIAGSRSHGYFSHEHNAGCLLLADKLNESGQPVVATVYKNGWPFDPTALDNADTVVSYCDGGGRHYLNEHLEEFDKLVEDRGVGLVCLHYGVETEKGAPGDHFLKWIGGYFETFWSVNPHWTAKFDEFPDHAITNGVEPFEINDEWYYHMRFVPDMKNVTPILSDLPPRESLNRPDGHHSGNPAVRAAVMERKEPQHVAWAYERPDNKGRGFGFTGGHFHKNWQDDNFRKVVLNAIVWSAGLEVPEAGVPSETPTQEELEANQDYPKPGTAKVESKKKEPVNAGKAKPIVSSPVVTTKTPGHAVDIKAGIKGAKELWLVVTDGGNGFSCDWCDWVTPTLASGDQIKSLTDLKWTDASSQYGQVQINKNAGGQPMRVAGENVTGIGTHANSVIRYELPKDHTFTEFRCKGGLDNGGTDQGSCGEQTSVQFHIFTTRPAAQYLTTGGGDTTVAASHESVDAVEQLKVHEDLTATLFASEPMMTNPASIDIDHLGRVWVCEAINYRAFRNKDVIGDRKEGDRILVLEDTNHDAKADKASVFYQGSDVDSAHGILILPTPSGKGLRALVSALDSVFFLIDEDGDLKADKKELLFTGIKGAQHDHGIHACHFGPDGKLYFNFGNAGVEIHDKDGKLIVDKAGNEVKADRKPYQEGMVFRCNLDGSEFETLGWNFRNNWEVCVDSFGTMWQSDNDDDGNRGVRINYVMEYGNYGYKDELTGAGWKDPRTGWSEEIPLRHWHLNDPGVVPNLLQTGAGAPTGICLYEGKLLPEVFRGNPIHTDAGPNICRAYNTERDGAGYKAEIVDILDGAANKWFRPSDVCVAPDGSILVADWYDPGVGGHRMQDVARGRLFRVAPKGDIAKNYTSPKVDVSTVEGAITALSSPNMSARYLGWNALMSFGQEAVSALNEMWQQDDDILRARALWALGKLDIPGDKKLEYIRAATSGDNVNLQVAAMRLARQIWPALTDALPQDVSNVAKAGKIPRAVVREHLICIRELDFPNEIALWTAAANIYMLDYNVNGIRDRWLLEAVGIAAEGQWDECLNALLKSPHFDMHSQAGRDLIWRSRGTQTPELLVELIRSPQTPKEELPRLLRALDFQKSESLNKSVLELSFGALDGMDDDRVAFVRAEALNRVNGFDVTKNPEYAKALNETLDAQKGTEQFIRLVDKFSTADRYADLLVMAQQNPESQVAVEAIKTLYNKQQHGLIKAALHSDDRETVEKTLTAMATAADGRNNGLLMSLLKDEEQPLWARRQAVSSLAAALPGAKQLLEMAQKNEYPPKLKDAVAASLITASWRAITEPASKIFPPPPGKDKPLPPLSQLLSMKGSVANGRVIFNTTGTCNKCHIVNNVGREIGPNLSEIGSKLTKQALIESILYPSAGISHNYEAYIILTLEGQVYTGLIASETDIEVQLKDEKGILRKIPRVNIEMMKKQDVSLMPGDIQKLMTTQELVDVVEYLTTLKK